MKNGISPSSQNYQLARKISPLYFNFISNQNDGSYPMLAEEGLEENECVKGHAHATHLPVFLCSLSGNLRISWTSVCPSDKTTSPTHYPITLFIILLVWFFSHRSTAIVFIIWGWEGERELEQAP
jgi:hypothetical protein